MCGRGADRRKDRVPGVASGSHRRSELMDFYLIRGIPRFILIDPEGNIVDSDFLRPTNPETETYLKQLF